jgi:crotonobetaine/carnitine-CoA ligase
MPAHDTVLPNLITSVAREDPGRPYVVNAEAGGEVWTYGQADAEAWRWADAYYQAGVRAGDTVLTMLPPCVEAVASWLGIGRLGALEVTVNTGYVGNLLKYVIDDSQAATLVVHASYLPGISADLAGSQLRRIVVIGEPWPPASDGHQPASDGHLFASDGREIVTAEEFLAAASGQGGESREFRPAGRGIATVVYTSGTTGPSKGVLVTWRQAELTGSGIMPADLFSARDAIYSPFPVYHMSGKAALYGAALLGARVIMRRRFDTWAFWDDIRTYQGAVTNLVGAMANFLYQQPEQPGDADTPLRDVVMLPVMANVSDFERRFGLRVRSTFNMTETSCCILTGAKRANETSCGRARPGFQARIVDADDEEVPDGQLGELVLRSDEPWTLMAGYWRKPEATADAWRNLWFHTGDAFTRDAEGNFYFVDRMKDAIRRRGENISSAEVEAEVNAHPAVLESAAIAVPAELAEDEVKVVLVLQPGQQLDLPELADFLSGRMAPFMVPRYLEIVDALPKTPTEKVRKAQLRAAGVGTAWDRLAPRPTEPAPAEPAQKAAGS